MEIAIIDSGLNNFILDKSIKIENYNDFSIEDNKKIHNNRLVGIHGTLVLHTINKYIGCNGIYNIYNVINTNNRGSILSVIKSIEDILNNENIRIIVICLTVNNIEYNDKLRNLCKECIKKGKIVVASESNSNKISIPAQFKNVIGVGKSILKNSNEFIFNKNKKIQVGADISEEFVPINNGRYRMFCGTSKATAKFVHYVYKGISEGVDNYNELEEYLSRISIKYNIKTRYDEYSGATLRYKNIFYLISNYLKNDKTIFHENITNTDFFFESLVFNEEQLDMVFLNLFKKFNLNVNLDKIPYYKIKSAYKLANFIGEICKY